MITRQTELSRRWCTALVGLLWESQFCQLLRFCCDWSDIRVISETDLSCDQMAEHRLKNWQCPSSKVLSLFNFAEAVSANESGVQGGKLGSSWDLGIWLGRSTRTNEHLVGTRVGAIKARTVRRRPETLKWDRQFFDAMNFVPWLIDGQVTRPEAGCETTPGCSKPFNHTAEWACGSFKLQFWWWWNHCTTQGCWTWSVRHTWTQERGLDVADLEITQVCSLVSDVNVNGEPWRVRGEERYSSRSSQWTSIDIQVGTHSEREKKNGMPNYSGFENASKQSDLCCQCEWR